MLSMAVSYQEVIRSKKKKKNAPRSSPVSKYAHRGLNRGNKMFNQFSIFPVEKHRM